VRIQLRNHGDTQTVKRSKLYKDHGDIKFGMLQVCGNEISLCKWSGGIAYLRTLEGTLNTTRWPPKIKSNNANGNISHACQSNVIARSATSALTNNLNEDNNNSICMVGFIKRSRATHDYNLVLGIN